ncbi:MAG: hypothetical protein A4E57_01873 [Syntrophorhabdaceae bacterium PtaU1.Bin034]|nr:MAG: hypothetical protein A4E57_01873 [Syntrophorhabdaceae bacterium PtaU1.Bin034]
MRQLIPGALFRIVAVDAANAHHVGSVFRSMYGEDFHVKDVYQPEVLWEEIRAGRLFSMLAFDREGRAAGYISMFRSSFNPRLWEVGNMIVHPDHARTNLSSYLVGHYLDFLLPGTADADGIFGEAVCCHYFTQVNMAKAGMIDCGLELDQLDGDSFKDGKSNKAGTARVSCVLNFNELTDPLEPEYLPVHYEGILRRIASALRPRTFLASTAPLPRNGATKLEEKYYASSRTWKVVIPTIGGDWAASVENILDKSRQRQVISLQVTLNTADPHISAAVEVLREHGFFFGGLAPRWFGTDGVLMQRLSGSDPEYGKTKVYTRIAKELIVFIQSDSETVRERQKRDDS